MFERIRGHKFENTNGSYMPQGYMPYDVRLTYDEPGRIILSNGDAVNVISIWWNEPKTAVLLYVETMRGDWTHIAESDYAPYNGKW